MIQPATDPALQRPLKEMLDRQADDRPAFSDGRRTVSYRDLLHESGILAAGLGIARGQRVLVHVGSRVEFVEYSLAVLRAGGVCTPVNVRSTEPELGHLVDDSGAALLITEARYAETARRVQAARPHLRVQTVEDGPAADAGSLRDDLGVDEPSWLIYTSGTTGRPKGVLTTQRAMQWSAATCYGQMYGITRDDTIVWPLPLHHAWGVSMAVSATIVLGAHTRIVDGDLPEVLRAHPGSILAGVPTTYLRLRQEVRTALPSPRLCMSAGAPCTQAARAAADELFGVQLLDGYGCSETSGKIAVQLPGQDGLTPVPGMDVRITDGEIEVRGPSLMLGYHGEQQGQYLVDGWYRTRDAGRLADGHLVLDGRVDDIIVCGGVNVHPLEIEAVLAGASSVRDVLVTGRPDPVLGAVPVAFVVPGDGGADFGALRRLCRERLSEHKIPVAFHQVDQIPRTASGKPLRNAVTAPAPVLERDFDALVHRVLAELGEAGDGWRDRPFHDLGLTSLGGVQVRHRLADATGLPLPQSLIYDFPTPGAVISELRRLASGAAQVTESQPPAVPSDPIAIVAMACRYPGGVSTPEDLWDLVSGGVDATGDFPEDRGWNVAELYDPDPDRIGGSTTRRGGFLYDAADFDAAMFRMAPREAEATDPQHRLLLEISWEAFERAGINTDALHGSDTGVFVGVMYGDYSGRFDVHEQEGRIHLGSAHALASGRISYMFGLTGPAVTVDTACSSSLVALHSAVRALRAGECSLALAGGATVMASPRSFRMFSRQRGLSPDGRCRSYAAGADGTAWSEGAGVLLLERLSDARRNGHPVLAIVAGTAVNSDGASNGLTAPNGRAQRALIQTALADAGLSAVDVDAVEGHGTATPLGDPIEVEALAAAYGGSRAAPLWLGSVKSNIGHTQAAAGVAGVIKVVEALRHEELPPSRYAEQPSPRIDWSAGRVELLAQPRPWPVGERVRRAGVSAFGIGGTNSHVIIAEPPAAPPAERHPEFPAAPWLLSANDDAALRDVAARLLTTAGEHNAADVAYTLATRTALGRRAVVPAGDLQALRALAEGEISGRTVREPADVAYLFSGQGAQRAGMGEELARCFPVFSEAYETACDALGGSVRQVAAAGGELLDRTDHTQAALFAFEVASYRLLESWGMHPAVVTGHSIGEIAAAHVAGVLSLADAAKLVAARGRLMAALPPGGVMIAVRATEAEVAPWVAEAADRVAIAAINTPGSLVLSGEQTATTAIAARFPGASRLRVSHAFHSPLMAPMLDELREVASTLTHHQPRIPLVSGLTGQRVAEFGPEHWVRHAREAVRFADAVTAVAATGVRACLELGPSAVLSRAAGVVLPAVSSTGTGQGVLAALGELHSAGVAVRWDSVFAGSGARRVPLPTYPFQRRRYWLEPEPAQAPPRAGHALLGPALVAPDSPRVVHGGSVGVATSGWLADHVVGGATILPATAFVEIALHAGGADIAELTIETPLQLDPASDVELQVVVDDDRMDIYAQRPGDTGWTRHASGRLQSTGTAPKPMTGTWPPTGADELDVAAAYDNLTYGPAFRAVTALWRRGDELFAEVELPARVSGRFGLHPVLLDAAVHAAALAEPLSDVRVPFIWNGVHLHATAARRARVRLLRTGPDTVHVELFSRDGAPVATVESMLTRPLTPVSGMLHRLRWVPVPAAPAADDIRIIEVNDTDVRTATGEVLAALQEILPRGERALVVTRNATGSDPDLAAAAVWGLVSAAAVEYRDQVTVVDLDSPLPAHRVRELVSGTGEPQVAIRGSVPHVPRLAPAQPMANRPIDPAGTVLITGGTGALGALLARHLVAHHGVRHLLLVSRSGSEAPDADQLRQLPADVRIVAADIADPDTVRRLVDECDPPLTAVLHAAAVVADKALTEQTPAGLDTVLRPKADAAWVLHEATRHLPLSAFVLFSSAAGTFGNAGQANYAAANRYLDALATHRHAVGLPAVSLVWGLWATGLGDRIPDVARRRIQASGVEALTDEQGLALFDAALATDEPVLVAARLNLTAPMIPHVARTVAGPPAPVERHQWPAQPSEQELRELLRAELAAVLGHPDPQAVPVDEQFTALGMDSLAVIDLRNRLSQRSGVEVSVRTLFDHPTITALARHMHAEA